MAKMMLFLVASGLLALLPFSAALDHTLDAAWEGWKNFHGKIYLEEEEPSHRATWEDNWRMIEKHNWEVSQGMHTYRLGMNHFGDLTNEEFSQKMNCLLPRDAEPLIRNASVFNGGATQKTPKCVDWRKKGCITLVKDQDNCGSGWTLSGVRDLEGLCFKDVRKHISLSEPNLVDYAWEPGNHGCRGRPAHWAFEYVKRKEGTNTEQDYPYDGEAGVCRYTRENTVCKCTSYKMVPPGDEQALERAVATVGPVAVAIDAWSSALQFYKSAGLNIGVTTVIYIWKKGPISLE